MFCSIATVVYAAGGTAIVRIAFGAEYAEAAGLLWLFGMAMTGFALLNVLLIPHLGHDRSGVRLVARVGARWPRSGSSSFSTVTGGNWSSSTSLSPPPLLAGHELLTRGLLTRTLLRG